MSDVTQGQDAQATAEAPAPSTILNVPITKGKGSVAIDTAQIPQEVYEEALLQGLKVLLNRGMSKITKAELGDDDTVKKEAMLKAEKNAEDVLAGKIKFTGRKATTKASGAVMTEARRLARNLVKDAMKAHGIKISHVEASEITKAANAILADATEGPSLIAMATANLAEREKVPVAESIVSSIKISDKLVAKANERKAASKSQLSAKQAGLTKKSKPGTQATAH